VVLSGRTSDTLTIAEKELGPNAVSVVADNADPKTPGRLVAAARDTWGRVDGALISVGGPPKGPVSAVTDEQWTEAFGAVFLGAVRIAREIGGALPHGGALALVLSSSVRAPLPDMAISNGLRPGLAMIAKTLADELGPQGVRVNGLMPGRVATERVAELDAADGEPEEFGRAAAFLLSPAASFISGAMLPVDGGMLRAL
jgi:3-oxoacyl-[acyl-carrier protein] reductase